MPPVTLIVQVPPAQVGSAVLPSLDAVQVESVYATIDATAGGPVTPELLVADPSGQVIATKRQSDSIPAGDTGSATWALRLDDKAKAVASGGDYIFVAAKNESRGGLGAAPVSFTGIPQDARHLVIEGSWFGQLGIRFNNDASPAGYRVIASVALDDNGVVSVQAVSPGYEGILRVPVIGTYAGVDITVSPARFVLTVPYYRGWPYTSGFGNRSAQVEAWSWGDNTPVDPQTGIVHVTVGGFWRYPGYPTLPPPAITRIDLFDPTAAGGGTAALYKVK